MANPTRYPAFMQETQPVAASLGLRIFTATSLRLAPACQCSVFTRISHGVAGVAG